MERLFRRHTPGGQVKGLFTFALLAAFALLALMVVLLGARVYQSVEARAEDTHAGRTALAYLAGKVRAADPGAVSVLETAEGPVLVIATAHAGALYNTYIYDREGAVCEYFGSSARAFDPAFGETILDAETFSAAWETEDLLCLTVDGQTLHLYTAGGGGA